MLNFSIPQFIDEQHKVLAQAIEGYAGLPCSKKTLKTITYCSAMYALNNIPDFNFYGKCATLAITAARLMNTDNFEKSATAAAFIGSSLLINDPFPILHLLNMESLTSRLFFGRSFFNMDSMRESMVKIKLDGVEDQDNINLLLKKVKILLNTFIQRWIDLEYIQLEDIKCRTPEAMQKVMGILIFKVFQYLKIQETQVFFELFLNDGEELSSIITKEKLVELKNLVIRPDIFEKYLCQGLDGQAATESEKILYRDINACVLKLFSHNNTNYESIFWMIDQLGFYDPGTETD